jgi:hypothetical protein
MTFEDALKISRTMDRDKLQYVRIFSSTDYKIFYDGRRYELITNIGKQWFDKHKIDIENGKYLVGLATYYGNQPEFIDDNIGLYAKTLKIKS